VGNVERYVTERTEKATRYKMWPSSRDHTWIEMAILHDDVVREYCNDRTTHTIQCTSRWGISPLKYPKFWTW